MAESILTGKMREELKELKKANRKKEREKQKRLKVQLEKIRMEDDNEVWKLITSVKANINEQLKGNKKTERYNVKTISTIPDYYEYQNPNDAKQKGNNKDEEWVKKFLAGGGTETQLMDAATESRVNIWRRIKWKRPIKPTKAKPAAPKNKLGAGGVG